jgi:hypothetical protein
MEDTIEADRHEQCDAPVNGSKRAVSIYCLYCAVDCVSLLSLFYYLKTITYVFLRLDNTYTPYVSINNH